jgi:hypothetical protein
VVRPVVALGLEKEVAGLTADHRNQPADQGGSHGILEHHDVSDQKADGAQQVQRLIDPAMVVEAMVVPSLSAQFRQKLVHAGSMSESGFRNRLEANIGNSLQAYYKHVFTAYARLKTVKNTRKTVKNNTRL